jgi:threonine dehydrogenase-like Zn-dependent dehydrogenase
MCGGVPGGQAEYVRVLYADVNCLVLPSVINDENAVLLGDILSTSYFGADMGSVKKDDVVAIWGLGPVGLLCARWCQILGAKKVLVCS